MSVRNALDFEDLIQEKWKCLIIHTYAELIEMMTSLHAELNKVIHQAQPVQLSPLAGLLGITGNYIRFPCVPCVCFPWAASSRVDASQWIQDQLRIFKACASSTEFLLRGVSPRLSVAPLGKTVSSPKPHRKGEGARAK